MPSLVIVDDDEQVRTTVGGLLRACGYEVRLFESAEAYLGQSNAGDCAIVDIQLPGITGLELEQRMRSERAGTAVLFISARDDVATREAVRRTNRQLLTKPFDDDALLAAIATATGHRSSAE